jgi:class 3 adenylate cyclase/Tfp pilus assembly protein PilF
VLLKRYLSILAVIYGVAAFGQANFAKDTTRINALIEEGKSFIGTDSAKAINLSYQALNLAKESGYRKGEGYALKNFGLFYNNNASYVEALDYFNQALTIFESIKLDAGIANMLGNIGAIYQVQGADEKALEFSLKSLKIAERMGDSVRIRTALINIGGTYHNKKDPKGLEYYLKVLPQLNSTDQIAEYAFVTGNMGEIYYDQGNYEKAKYYYQISIKAAGTDFSSAFSVNGIGKIALKDSNFALAHASHKKALEIAEKFDDQLQLVYSLHSIGTVYSAEGKTSLAIDYLNLARTNAEAMDDVDIELLEIYQELAAAYSTNKDYTNAFTYQEKYSKYKDDLYNIENKKKLNKIQFDFDLSKKDGELALNEEKLKSEKQARLGITITLGIMIASAFVIYRYYLKSLKTNKILDKQKDEIEGLLLNILPREVASELKNNGISKPRFFKEVCVLFSDFKGFTLIADKMSPSELVEELNECFIAFDSIAEKYGLEKIKTIGDSYMCASNLPSDLPDHFYKMIKGGMEMQQFIEGWNAGRLIEGKEPWQIRIGVHAGPVVAGVVGKKKYAYDIWGSTVNIASRMESSGTPGKVNISEFTYEKVKDRFECVHRGKISAKNVGDMEMYYVESEKVPHVIDLVAS